MKTFIVSVFAITFVAVAGCSTTHRAVARADSETVMVTYHVQPGKEAEFQTLLAHAWEVYQGEHLVYAQPHIIVRGTEQENETKFVEIFTWTKSPDNPPAGILAVWKQEQSLCDARDGQRGIEGGEVTIVTGK